MRRVNYYALFVIMVLLVSCGVKAYAADHYATTDMTWAEFYAGETGETSSALTTQGLDAISTPTTHGLARFPLVLGISSDSGTTISGLKAVQVRMSEDVYNALTDKTRFTFTDTSFDEYKPVYADGTFGKMVTETATASDAVATMATGSSARWGHYVISVQSADITIGSANRYCDYYLGALIETSEGKIYGLRHDNNIWSNTDIAFCVNENYTEPHGTGVTRDYDYTVNLEGKTITKLTYMLKDRPDVVINTNLYVKRQATATAKAESEDYKSASSVQVNFVLTSADGYTLSRVAIGSGRNSQTVNDDTYSYADGMLTLTNPAAGNYTATFSHNEYVDISAAFTIYDYYATTDMTWAEFYAAEIVNTSVDLLDAVSSPTARVANNFSQLVSVSNDIGGRDITGVKAVQVRMTGDVYNSLSNDTRYTFSDDVFSEYKPVNADGSFGKMVTQTTEASDAVVTLSSGASAVWGNYVLNISSVDITLGSGDTRYYLGALITTDDGKVYGMRHNNNLWFNAKDMALAFEEFVEVHGVSRKYAYTADLAGKTITQIQYMLKNQPDVVVSCDVYLPLKSSASAEVSSTTSITAGTNISIPVTFTGLPDGVVYELVSLYLGSGRNRTYITDYTYTNNTITINGEAASGDYTAIFRTDGYTDISARFTVQEGTSSTEGGYHYALTDMTWAEFYAGEIGTTSSALEDSGLDAVSSPTARIAGRFTQLVSESNDLGGRDILGVKDVQVRMTDEVYALLSNDSRYKFTSEDYAEYKDVNSDGTFGEMFTEYDEQPNATVTLGSGQNATWGNYMLNVRSIDITLGSGDTRDYLGALITTSDGQVYGLRHNSNLWFSANDIALSFKAFTEPHGISRDYDYTSDLEGKTITKIQYMLKNKPDVVVPCNVYLKLDSPASVSFSYPEGYHGILAGTGEGIDISFTNLPDGVSYDIFSVTPSIRHAAALDSSLYGYADGVLTLDPTLTAGRYKAVFSTERYSDLAVTVELYTTDATSLIISDDKNAAGLFFLLTPAGYVDATDKVLADNKFVNASDYTNLDDNYTENYTSGANMLSGSGFTFDVSLNNVSSDYKGIVGFSKVVYLTSGTLGTELYQKIYTVFNALPKFYEEWRALSEESLADAGLRIMLVQADGVSRDMSGLAGGGIIIYDDGTIMVNYGAMAADCAASELQEGTYQLSDEGESLFADGVKDEHIRVTMYIEVIPESSGTTSTDTRPDIPASQDTSPDTPASQDTRPDTPSSSTSLNLSDTALVSKILQGISEAVSGTQVSALPANASGSSRTVSDLTAQERAALSASEDIALVLPEMSVDKSAIYVCGVDLSDLEAGAAIFLHMFADGVDAANFEAADYGDAYMFLDDDGTETQTVPANQHVNIAAYMEAGETYSPVITTTANIRNPGSSGGGCTTGFAALSLAALAIFVSKHHMK